jgi:DNA ligase (NAD+)
MNSIETMKSLIETLNQAAEVYYQGRDEIMSNREYDALYDRLEQLERETGIILAKSPTQRVGYEVLSQLPKETHASPMLSLDKTKEVDVLGDWLGEQTGLLSWKMDGLTIVLTYRDGALEKAVTRGNGQVGEVVTNNAKTFTNLPLTVPFHGHMVLRGEAVISYSDFQKINETLTEEEQYKNPRNLCSGSVRQLNNKITAQRKVAFFAFALVDAEGVDFKNSQEQKMAFMAAQGFDVVDYKKVNAQNLSAAVAEFSEKIASNDFPSDGLVLLMDDIAYGESLGRTAKFPRNAMAFKWADEMADTTLLKIEWSASRTGLINPVAVFEPVELEGTTVSRASVHNVSIVRQLELGIGDRIQVYKANMIIPQIGENLTRSGQLDIPQVCPVCSKPATIQKEHGVEVLCCTNPECLAKKIKSLTLFVSRDAMNIEGLSEASIEKFMERGMLHELADLFRLADYRDEIVQMEGFGEKSCEKLLGAIEAARETTLPAFLYSLGIPNIGLSNAKMICNAFGHDLEKIRCASAEDLTHIDGVGEVIAKSFVEYFAVPEHRRIVDDLLAQIHIRPLEETEEKALQMQGEIVVITGSLEIFANRKALKERIEQLGGKVTGSVTSKTTCLINNDRNSTSSKNKKAKELNVTILTEKEAVERWGMI